LNWHDHKQFGTRMDFVGRRILVVEDDFLVSLATVDILESLGCDIVGPAANLATAVRLAQSESLDAAVLDIDIGGVMVWPVAEELHRRNVRFAFLSGYRRINGVPALFATVPHLEKPLDQTHLLRFLGTI
jgi:CheY-like chemotaxis protein